MDATERNRITNMALGQGKTIAAMEAMRSVLAIEDRAKAFYKALEPSSSILAFTRELDASLAKQRKMVEGLHKPLAAQQAQIEKLTGSLATFDKMFSLARLDSIKTNAFTSLLDQTIAANARKMDLFSTIGASETLKGLQWKDLQTSIASAAQALGPSSVQAVVEEALHEAEGHDDDAAVAFSTFARKLFQSLDPAIAIAVFFGVLQIVQYFYQPYYDFYVKEALSAKSDEGNRRALAKEIANEISRIDYGPTYRAVRRVVMKPMHVRLGARTNSPAIGQVKMGELVEVVDTQKDWARIKWRDAAGKEFVGWVFTRYLQRLQ